MVVSQYQANQQPEETPSSIRRAVGLWLSVTMHVRRGVLFGSSGRNCTAMPW